MNNGQKSLSINETFIIEGGNDGILSACTSIHTNNLVSCDDENTYVVLSDKIEPSKSIIPLLDDSINLGEQNIRFREINTVSGNSTVWSSTEKIITPELDLGLDSLGNDRIITANNSILQNDILLGGTY